MTDERRPPTPDQIERSFAAEEEGSFAGIPSGFIRPIGWIVVYTAKIDAQIENMIHGLRGLSMQDTALPQNRLKIPFRRKTEEARALAEAQMPPKIYKPVPSLLKRAEAIQKQRDDLVHGDWYSFHPQDRFATKMRPGTGDGRFRPVKFDVPALWALAWEAREIYGGLSTVGQHYSNYRFFTSPDNSHIEWPEGIEEIWQE
ncbi:hypothetical protein [Hoeflea sp.]|uniref:hypothetical protein n=1 Tax=Hoeflea sp. TaxID=1940281 RepID=UPI0019948512|nr:hypothetical protein [Hoeflea sp.]MBC7285479.1 hypothetical protein [Hoeflea sp.]